MVYKPRKTKRENTWQKKKKSTDSSRVSLVEFWEGGRRHDVLLVETVSLLDLLREQHVLVSQYNVLDILSHKVEVKTSKVCPVEQILCASEGRKKEVYK